MISVGEVRMRQSEVAPASHHSIHLPCPIQGRGVEQKLFWGKCLWEKSLQRQRGKGTTEDLYFWYKKQVKMNVTPSELAIRLGRKTTKGLR